MTNIDKAFIFVSIGIAIAGAVFTVGMGLAGSSSQTIPSGIIQQQALVEPEEEIEPFVSLNSDKFSHLESRHKTHELEIRGFVNDYIRGNPIIVIVEFPDNSEDEYTLFASKRGNFQTKIFLTNEYESGIYKIKVKYNNAEISSSSFLIVGGETEEEEIIEQVEEWQGVKLDKEKYDLPEYRTTAEILISGHVRDVDAGYEILLDLTKPDQSVEKIKTFPTKDGDFAYHLMLDSNSMIGTYLVTAKYKNSEIGSQEFTVEGDISLQSKTTIPSWIKSNAKWWSTNSIPDSSFIQGIEFLIKENIINIPDLPASTEESESEIPDWVRKNAGWWADEAISDEDFINGIKFLVQNGIINVNN